MAETIERHRLVPKNRKDHFLQLMFFQPSRPDYSEAAPAPIELLADPHVPLHGFMARPGTRYALPAAQSAPPVRFDSPATEVMTDLRVVTPVTVDADASVDTANRLMIDRRVRALFVVDGASRNVQGVVTATDVLGERPLQAARRFDVPRGEVAVRDIMTPADRLDVLDLHDVVRAHVGNIVATLQQAGRQHALVVEIGQSRDANAITLCGIFSLTQIARQLGVVPGPAHDIARTFAEIESAIAA